MQLCLQSVQAALKDIESEIIVVDNDSNDGSCKMVKESFPDVTLIENDTNYGFSKGNNIGIEKAKGEYLCILNPDTVVAEDTFKILLNFAASKDKLGIVGCKLIDGSGKFLQESKRNIPTAVVSIQKMIGYSNPYYANQLDQDEEGEVDILAGAFMFLKREMFYKLNGFDEDYFMYGEDIDFCYKAIKMGYKNYYCPDTTVIHFKGESTLKDKFYAKHFYSAMEIFYKKHFKKNFIVDSIISIGIKLISIFYYRPKLKKSKILSYILISNSPIQPMQLALKKEIYLLQNDSEFRDHQEIIFDASMISFKEIIIKISNLSKQKRLTFKILPKKANFIIGSNSSKSNGEIIFF